MADVTAELEHLKILAKGDPSKRFDRLYRLLKQPGLLAIAKGRIAGNKGAQTPGVDGQTMADMTNPAILRLSDELQAGTYQPKPVRRVYIPKKNGKLRPLGIPASRDKIVQAGVAFILEALYEPIFRKCSHGFRPEHSPITALRQISTAYRSGAKWIIEGDITDCFGSIPHGAILNCLRKRIKDERFIDLIRKMLQAGVMEAGSFAKSFSGTPQGGIASPILANVVLHELDTWLETQRGVNPHPETATERNARSNPEYMRLHHRIMDIQRCLDGKRPMPKKATPEGLRAELREKLYLRSLQPRSLPRKVTYYTRYADDFVVLLCDASKADALQLKTQIAEWMQLRLGLTLNQDKTHVTHWQEKVRFLGYNLQGRKNRNGTGWMFLETPKEAVRNVVAKIQQATRYPQAPEYDVFQNVNAVARGWSNYYRYAHNNNVIGGKLSLVIYWRTVHYLGKRHHRSIAKVMKNHYARDPHTGCKGLYVYKPGKPSTLENRCFIWHKTLPRKSIGLPWVSEVQDIQPYIDRGWAQGRSLHKKLETRERADLKCEHCGMSGVTLYVHHPNRLVKAKRDKKGMGNVAQSGMEQRTILLCRACHTAYHAKS
ncbi:MAG TPA: group II intron reverse transcriptase/maturase [Anaerolineaceae bacterium]|nr:group II intron reverse transcriptase/maturase [Anaerolineaceae bacterium]